MNKLDKFLLDVKTKTQITAMSIKEAASQKATGDENLIVKVMLMVVAVVLVIAFRETLGEIINSLLTSVEKQINSIFGGSPT